MSNAEHLDAVIIGAGISGISAAYHLQKHCHTKRYKVLERRQNLGGTWDLFNYPGIRSDSDMYTFGFSFKHWNDDSAIAEKSKILSYLNETVSDFGIDKRIDYGVNVQEAHWSSEESRWNLVAEDGRRYTCQYLFMCSGYYSYDKAYQPDFEGIETFKGSVVHPQFWPKDLDYANKKVVIIGSGATAVTLVPAMAEAAQHVTMLQRSPTYMGAKPSVDPIANKLAAWFGRWAARWWFILSTMYIFIMCKLFPKKAKDTIRNEIKDLLGDKFNEKDFTPKYDP
ncbi:MAG: NAD(P)/FAD-dependent oxidoreductase, partial [Gammaproteobacteria bacterium]|nr:NAD(P)/FAD-dependent oxidoreductase [Gammaproteobacteria bacterium]